MFSRLVSAEQRLHALLMDLTAGQEPLKVLLDQPGEDSSQAPVFTYTPGNVLAEGLVLDDALPNAEGCDCSSSCEADSHDPCPW